jgi:hypothetical protein
MKAIRETERKLKPIGTIQQSTKIGLLNMFYGTSGIFFKIFHPTLFHDAALDLILCINAKLKVKRALLFPFVGIS